jgi:uncharacterized short protein YbdD (DUF466 family)
LTVAAVLQAVGRGLRGLWAFLREASGDDKYERYLAHHGALHADEPPLSRQEFFRRRLDRKWSGVTRCC